MPKLIDTSQIKIIETIFKNPGINLREIINKTRLSPNYVSKYINLLSQREILREERLEKRRVYLRRFFLNLKSNQGKNIFILVKEEEKELFFQKYPKLKPIFEQLIEEIKNIELLLVYGSYARFAAEKDSDLDILIVGNIANKQYIREIFVSLDLEVSIKIEQFKDFKKRVGYPLHQQIVRDNILIYDSGKFIDMLSKQIV